MLDEDNPRPVLIEQRESIKLTKLTKGFNWEIKLVGDNNDSQLDRLKKLNEKMEDEYGSYRTNLE